MQNWRLFGIVSCFAGIALAGCSGGSSSTSSAATRTTTLAVPATSCPWLATLPAGSFGIPFVGTGVDTGDDHTPGESPTQVTGLTITGGEKLSFSATGTVTYSESFAAPYITADGDSTLIFGTGKDYSTPAEQPLLSFDGMSGILAPAGALIGVFLSDSSPINTAAPAFTDYSTVTARDYISASPALQQVFYVGNGRTTSGTIQTIIVPRGATRLYLGTMDGFGWYNNAGSFSVTVTSTN